MKALLQRLGLYFLGIGAITAVAGIMAPTTVLFVAEVIIQLCLQHFFHALFIEVVEEGFKIILIFELLEKILGKMGLLIVHKKTIFIVNKNGAEPAGWLTLFTVTLKLFTQRTKYYHLVLTIHY